MTFDKIPKPRYLKETLPKQFRLQIPSQRNWFMVLFLGFWMIAWAAVEIIFTGILFLGLAQGVSSVFTEATATGLSPLVILLLTTWIVIWTVVGAITFYIWLWQIKGVEEILISPDSLCIKKTTPVWTQSKSYFLQEVKSLNLLSPQKTIWNTLLMSCGIISFGSLGFEYGESIVQFGIGLDESVAQQIFEDIKELISRPLT